MLPIVKLPLLMARLAVCFNPLRSGWWEDYFKCGNCLDLNDAKRRTNKVNRKLFRSASKAVRKIVYLCFDCTVDSRKLGPFGFWASSNFRKVLISECYSKFSIFMCFGSKSIRNKPFFQFSCWDYVCLFVTFVPNTICKWLFASI